MCYIYSMIINTGQRTDIPAFYSTWFANRLKEGFVCVRNPFNPASVSRYQLNPQVVDIIGFCSKNPAPFFKYMDLLKDYGQYWFVTITGYDKDIEPNVPNKRKILEDFKTLSSMVGINSIGWRYDPIFIDEKYTVDFHLKTFEKYATTLDGYTNTVVISFIDIYEKVKRNFPDAVAVSREDKLFLGQEIIRIASEHGITVKPCGEGDWLSKYGADCRGCMTISDYEKAIGKRLIVPAFNPSRKECACYLHRDIGAYDTCNHLCKYCYANNDQKQVAINMQHHDPNSPFLIGNYRKDDIIKDVPQESWIDNQLNIIDFLNT